MRYTVKIDFYIYEDSDEAAIKKALEIAKKQRDEKDDQCRLLEVVKTPFASLTSKTIY